MKCSNCQRKLELENEIETSLGLMRLYSCKDCNVIINEMRILRFFDKKKSQDVGTIGALKMRRLDKIMESLNEINNDLLGWNDKYSDWNYKIKFYKCEILYQEIESKLFKKEKKYVETLRRSIIEFMENMPIEEKVEIKMYRSGRKRLEGVGFKIIKSTLSNYESVLRKLLDDHGMA